MNLSDAFAEGWLFHFFSDVCWEEDILQAFIAGKNPGEWFPPYREQIGLASNWLYHNVDWAHEVWEKIINAPLAVANIDHSPAIEKMDLFRSGVLKKHQENNTAMSEAFPLELLTQYAKETAARYRNWRKQ